MESCTTDIASGASAERLSSDKQGKIRTFTRKLVNPLAMRPEDIDIVDIAHHLSNECRYSGACPEFYSVSQHSYLVSLAQSGGPELQLAALLHDAAEAYLKDLASPVKHSPLLQGYCEVEEALMRTIFETFGLEFDLLAQTKRADDWALHYEMNSFWHPEKLNGEPSIVPWTPKEAERAFMSQFLYLRSCA